jgi:hypothetical protein
MADIDIQIFTMFCSTPPQLIDVFGRKLQLNIQRHDWGLLTQDFTTELGSSHCLSWHSFMKKNGSDLFHWSSLWARCGVETRAHSIASCPIVITERQVPPFVFAGMVRLAPKVLSERSGRKDLP